MSAKPDTLTAPLGSPAVAFTEVAGAKAGRLSELLAAGFRVPDGFVVTVGAFERFLAPLAPSLRHEAVERAPIPAAVDTAIRDALLVAGLDRVPIAVRSSGVAEDLPDASFAGQYESVVGVTG